MADLAQMLRDRAAAQGGDKLLEEAAGVLEAAQKDVMRAYDLEANWSRCSRACAGEQTKREQAEAHAERLAEALRPLAELDLTADDFDQRPDSQPIYARNKTVITVGDVRKARAALHPTAAQEPRT